MESRSAEQPFFAGAVGMLSSFTAVSITKEFSRQAPGHQDVLHQRRWHSELRWTRRPCLLASVRRCGALVATLLCLSLACSSLRGLHPTRPTNRHGLAFFAPWDNSVRKQKLLDLIEGTSRGASEPAGRRTNIQEAFEDLEGQNPTASPLTSDLLKGDWELLWTTSEATLGSKRPFFLQPQPNKPILQFLDPIAGVIRNLEDTPLGRNTVEGEISPLTAENKELFFSSLDNFLFFKVGANQSKGGTYMPDADSRLEQTTVGVRFKKFNILNFLSFPAPDKATGILQNTYLDDDLRLSRSDRGGLFVFRRFSAERTD